MSDQELRKLIEQLHDEIQNAHTVDEQGQELLSHLDADIRELLNRSGGNAVSAHPAFLTRLSESIVHFEVTHPALTMMIQQFPF